MPNLSSKFKIVAFVNFKRQAKGIVVVNNKKKHRLDYIFCTPILLANSSLAKIHECPWSDDHIVSFQTTYIGLAPQTSTWRLNDALLTDPVITSQIADKLLEYFRLNNVDETSPPILWAAHKVVLRGYLIELATARKRERGAKVATLTRELYQLYHLHH